MSDLTPPSRALTPPLPELRRRLAVALRDVDLLRRLIRVAEYAAKMDVPLTTADALTPPAGRKGASRE